MGSDCDVLSSGDANRIKRTPLGTTDFPASYQTVMRTAESAQNIWAARHTHPGIKTSYMLEGEAVIKVHVS